MFKGISLQGINRKVSSILECTKLNRQNNVSTLAIPETYLIKMAKAFPAEHRIQMRRNVHQEIQNQICTPKPFDVLKGILPSLRYLVYHHVDAVIKAYQNNEKGSNSQRISIGSKPNAWDNPKLFTQDPYGNSDYFCKLCNQELSNIYMHCDGCQLILSKDFNICISCHDENRYKIYHQMHPLNNTKHPSINHTGHFTTMYKSRCPCRKGSVCKDCGFCTGCSCTCHQCFTLHHRFMNVEDEISLLKKSKQLQEMMLFPRRKIPLLGCPQVFNMIYANWKTFCELQREKVLT